MSEHHCFFNAEQARETDLGQNDVIGERLAQTEIQDLFRCREGFLCVKRPRALVQSSSGLYLCRQDERYYNYENNG